MAEIVNVVATVASVFMGISIGASTVASAFGPVNSARSANVLRSALFAGVFAFIGAVTQGGNVTKTVGSGILGGAITELQAASVLIVAATLVILSVARDYPMPTAFTVIGAVIGAGLGAGSGVQWLTVARIVGYWLAVPVLAVGMGYGLASLIRRLVTREGSEREIRYALLIAGSYVSYTAGASAVGLAVGPMTGIITSGEALLVMGGLSMTIGAWLYSPRIIRAISFDYSSIGPRRSFAALATAGILAQVGIFYGIPISFNEAIVAAVIGSGMVEGRSNTDPGKILKTGAAWTGAFLLAGALTFTVVLLAGL
ncbi:MAG: anion permease [Candidatus Nanohaloarchaea archaeon]